MVRGDRQAVLAREPPVEDRGHRVGGVLIDRCGVAVPGRVGGEPREVGVEPLVDAPVGAHQRVDGELVEDHEHDGSGRAHVRRLDVGAAGEDQVRDVGHEQEQGQEHERRRAEHGQERARRGQPHVGDRSRRAERHCEHERGQRAGLRDRLEGDRPDQQRHADEVYAPAHRLTDPVRGPFEGEHRQRRREGDQQREGDDLPRRRAARGEELRVATEQVEQRLRDRQRPQHGDVQPPLEQRPPAHRGHASRKRPARPAARGLP